MTVARHEYFRVEPPIVLGHRGAAGEAPENTLVSFERALATGADIVESDLRLTADGVPVLLHDATIERTTDGSGAVEALRFAELASFDAGYRFTTDDGADHPYRGRGLTIPSLAEALDRFPGARFNLELKGGDTRLVERTLAVLQAAGRERRTLLTAEDDRMMHRLRAALDRSPTPTAVGASVGDVTAWVQAAAGGPPPPAGPDALQVPVEFGGIAIVTPALVRLVHQRGLQLHVWTVNDPARMETLLELGVDGLVTDFPAVARALIERRRSPRG